jgi:hypothetical protein
LKGLCIWRKHLKLFLKLSFSNLLIAVFYLFLSLNSKEEVLPIKLYKASMSFSADFKHICASDGVWNRPPICQTIDHSPNEAVKVPEHVRSVIQLATGAAHSCALHWMKTTDQAFKQVISCWGDARLPTIQVPQTPDGMEPQTLVGGRWHNCAVYRSTQGPATQQTKMLCWGTNSSPVMQKKPSDTELQQIHSISSERNSVCVVHGAEGPKVKCWGDLTVDVPTKFLKVAPADEVFCYRTNSLSCYKQHLIKFIDDKSVASILHSADQKICRLQNKMLSCNSTGKPSEQYALPAKGYDFKFAEQVPLVLTAQGVLRVNNEGKFESIMSNSELYLRDQLTIESPKDVYPVALLLSRKAYKFDADFLQQYAFAAEKGSYRHAAMAAVGLSPFLSPFPYPAVAKELMAPMSDSLRKFEAAWEPTLKVHKQGDQQFAARLIAITLLTSRQLLLRVSSSQEESPQAKECEDIIAALGSCSAGGECAGLKDRVHAFSQSIATHTYLSTRSVVIHRLAEFLE